MFLTLEQSAAYIKTLLQRISYNQGETVGEPVYMELEMAEDDTGKATFIHQFKTVHRIPVEVVDAVANGKMEEIIQQVVVRTG
jgi:hypothetical protein